MKLATLTVFASASATRVARQADRTTDDRLETEKRYFQLVDMMTYFNPDFDERKYWAYGCNCLLLGDRPMSDPGHGPPIDALDTVCKAYKDCVKCARMEHGNTCIGEFIRYRYGFSNGEVQCKNNVDTCERDLCECDALFARQHVGAKDVFDVQFHMFWSTNNGGQMWDPENDYAACPRGGSGAYDPQCCKADGGAWHLYNAVSKDCCADGRVVPTGQC